jgi:catechol 2,3-dioxygenase-like lactoylglutathione lyase family enzyme
VLRISTVNLWVHDQEAALDFWTAKVGFELRSDATFAELGAFRWLTVGPPGQPDVELVLMAVPEPPVLTEAQTGVVRAAMSQGLAGPVFLVTDDVERDFRELTARGVEFTEPPERRPFGIDAGFRDPSGNQVRLTQVLA